MISVNVGNNNISKSSSNGGGGGIGNGIGAGSGTNNTRRQYKFVKFLRIRSPLLCALLFIFCLSYMLIMHKVFEPTSFSINLQHLEDIRYLLNSAACSAASTATPRSSPAAADGDGLQQERTNTVGASGPAGAAEINLVLILVGSHPSHVDVRRVIRRTWGNPGLPNYHFKLVFLFGELETQHGNEQLAEESRQHGDIVQGDFNDSYYNVTMRDLMGLKWAWEWCAGARYVIHADDDIAIDVYRLMEILKERFSNPAVTDSSIGCYEIVHHAVPRRYGRYAVSANDFKGPYYDDYCMGWLYVVTPSVGKRLFDASLSETPLWINDVFITGRLASVLGLGLRNIGLKYSLEFKDTLTFVRNSSGQLQLEMAPTRAIANMTEIIQEIYKSNYDADQQRQ